MTFRCMDAQEAPARLVLQLIKAAHGEAAGRFAAEPGKAGSAADDVASASAPAPVPTETQLHSADGAGPAAAPEAPSGAAADRYCDGAPHTFPLRLFPAHLVGGCLKAVATAAVHLLQQRTSSQRMGRLHRACASAAPSSGATPQGASAARFGAAATVAATWPAGGVAATPAARDRGAEGSASAGQQASTVRLHTAAQHTGGRASSSRRSSGADGYEPEGMLHARAETARCSRHLDFGASLAPSHSPSSFSSPPPCLSRSYDSSARRGALSLHGTGTDPRAGGSAHALPGATLEAAAAAGGSLAALAALSRAQLLAVSARQRETRVYSTADTRSAGGYMYGRRAGRAGHAEGEHRGGAGERDGRDSSSRNDGLDSAALIVPAGCSALRLFCSPLQGRPTAALDADLLQAADRTPLKPSSASSYRSCGGAIAEADVAAQPSAGGQRGAVCSATCGPAAGPASWEGPSRTGSDRYAVGGASAAASLQGGNPYLSAEYLLAHSRAALSPAELARQDEDAAAAAAAEHAQAAVWRGCQREALVARCIGQATLLLGRIDGTLAGAGRC
jgi:hypothetical protein